MAILCVLSPSSDSDLAHAMAKGVNPIKALMCDTVGMGVIDYSIVKQNAGLNRTSRTKKS